MQRHQDREGQAHSHTKTAQTPEQMAGQQEGAPHLNGCLCSFPSDHLQQNRLDRIGTRPEVSSAHGRAVP